MKIKSVEEIKTREEARQIFNNDYESVDDHDLEELTKQIREGNTSGRLDNEEGKHIYWELKVNVWRDEK